MKKKYYTPEMAYSKLQQYCVYQERCHQEVRYKLIELGIYGDTLEELIAKLIAENFLNEERFAKAFAGGKFRIKHWGRIKIKQELKMRNISNYCIQEAMKEISDEACKDTIHELIQKKCQLDQNTLADPKFKNNVYQLLARKGFENHLIMGDSSDVLHH